MKVVERVLNGVLLIDLKDFADPRGFFVESYNREKLQAVAGIETDFLQDNHSRSCQGVLRGLHYQVIQPQSKLVRVVQGEVYDVVVDLRRSSSSFGEWKEFTLSESKPQLLWVPEGFAHGFVVVSEEAHFLYKVSDYYSPKGERCLRWNDTTLSIPWPLEKPLVSDKDAAGKSFQEVETFA